MGKVEELKQEFAKLNHDTAEVIHNFRSMMDTETNREGLLKAGATEIGRHIQRMRDAGHPGRVFTDFYRGTVPHFERQEHELKEMLLVLETNVQKLEANVPTLVKLAGHGEALVKAWKVFEHKLEEAKSFKSSPAKVVAAAAGVTKYDDQLKALKEMQEAVTKSRDKEGGAIHFLTSSVLHYDNHPGYFKQQRDELVTNAFKNTRGSALTNAEEEMYLQLMEERVLNARYQKAKGLHKMIVDHCQAKEQEILRPGSTAPPSVEPAVAKAVEALKILADPFEKALRDGAVMFKIKQAGTVGAAIRQAMVDIVGWRADAIKHWDALRSALQKRYEANTSKLHPHPPLRSRL